MVQQGLVKEEVFSFCAKEGGEIVFDGVDHKHFKGNHTYIFQSLKRGTGR
jgi:phytepsin